MTRRSRRCLTLILVTAVLTGCNQTPPSVPENKPVSGHGTAPANSQDLVDAATKTTQQQLNQQAR